MESFFDYECLPDEVSDEELVERAAQGIRSAFTILFTRYRHQLVSFIMSRVRDWQLAEDTAQETFMAVLRQIHTFEKGKRFKPWLFAIAAHKAVDILRSRGRRPTVSLDDRPLSDWESSYAEVFTQKGPDVVESLGQQEAFGYATAVASQILKPREQQIFELTFYHDMRPQEVGAVLHMDPRKVSYHLHQAVLRLRRKFEKTMDPCLAV